MRDLMELHEELQRIQKLLDGELPDTTRSYLVGAVQAIQWALGKNDAEALPSPSMQHASKPKGRAP